MNIVRTIAERISRRMVLRRKLPRRCGGGTIYVSPDASLRLWRFNLDRAEPHLFDWACELVNRGDVVWDIGANVGMFSFAAASCAGADGFVLAVEPDVWLAGLLLRSSVLQPLQSAPVRVLPAAIGATVGARRLCVAARGRAANYIEGAGSTQANGSRFVQETVTVSLDWLLETFPAPYVVKIDVEGMEQEVLEGASRLLAEVRPKLICEVAKENADAVERILRRNNYQLFDADAAPAHRAVVHQPPWNTLALPATS